MSELPPYRDGRVPDEIVTAVRGTTGRLDAHALDDKVVLVVVATVTDVGHSEASAGLRYREVLKADDIYEFGGDAGPKLVAALRAERRAADEGAEGLEPIPGLEVVVDGSGVVLTPAEVAAIREDPVGKLLHLQPPVVVVADDGERRLWPDDYPAGAARPVVGDTDDAGCVVVELLDAETGEVEVGDDDEAGPFDDDDDGAA